MFLFIIIIIALEVFVVLCAADLHYNEIIHIFTYVVFVNENEINKKIISDFVNENKIRTKLNKELGQNKNYV